MRIGLARGRLFDERDDPRSERVAILSESAARRLWPGEDPIGKRIFMPTHGPTEPRNAWRTVVGVVRDVRYRGLDQALLDVYDPALQAPTGANSLVVRTSGDPLALAAAVRMQARSLYPRVVVDGVTSMDAVVARALAPWRLGAWMLALFAAVAFLLSVLGLFSLVSLDVAQRRQEFAIRLAMGARASDIVGGVLRRAGWRVLAGGGLGLLLAFAAARGVRGLLYGVNVLDPATYAVVALVVAAVVALASYVPARRATAVDPLVLLREQ
jgi:putative ABC transport system permease protein